VPHPLVEPPDGVVLDPPQRAVVDRVVGRTGCLLVTGGPGSGKTTALVAAAAALVASGVPLAEVVVLTQSRTAAQRLRQKIMSCVGTTQASPRITTVHGWCRALLDRYAEPTSSPARLLTAPEQEFRVRELVGSMAWPSDVAQASRTPVFAGQLRNLLARARQLGLDPDDLAAAGRAAGRQDWQAAAAFFGQYLDVNDREGVLDYAELVHRSRLLMADDAVRAGVAAHTKALLVDEFAECDESAVALMRDAWRAGVPITAFADPSTQVFGFRGAWPAGIRRFPDEFGDAAGPAPVVELAARWRRPARREAWLAATADDEAALLAARLWGEHGRVGWDDMAVIVRAGGDAVDRLARGLSAAGVPVRVEGEILALADVPAVQLLLRALQLVVALAEGTDTAEQWLSVLCSDVVGLDEVDLRRLSRLATPPSDDWAPDRLQVADLPGELVPVWQNFDQTRSRLRAMADRLSDSTAAGVAWEVWTLAGWPDRLRADALARDESSMRANRDLDAVMAVFDLAGAELLWRGAGGVRDLMELVSQQVVQRDRARETPTGDAVTVLTAYQAKGRGWPVVAVAGAVEGTWPARGAPMELLEPSRLTADGQAPPPSRADQVGADRRLFALAASRASQCLIVTGAAGDDDARPSRFLDEIGLRADAWNPSGRATDSDQALSVRQLVAELRESAASPDASPGLVEAAAGVLGQLRAARLPDGRPLAPGADPANWWWVGGPSSGGVPLAEPGRPLRLAASGVASLLSCPRAWFLQHRAGAAPASGPQATFGSLAHALFAACAEGEPDWALVRQIIDDGWPDLGYASAWFGEGQRDVLDVLLQRFLAWRDGRPGRRLLGVELDFDHVWATPAGDVQVTGRVDRLELDQEGRLVVIDFKTGRSSNRDYTDQMGLYELGARAGVFDSLAPGVRAVAGPELVWPGVDPRRSDVGCRVDVVKTDDLVLSRLGEAAAILAAERFDAIAGPDCKFCAFWPGCPVKASGVGDD